MKGAEVDPVAGKSEIREEANEECPSGDFEPALPERFPTDTNIFLRVPMGVHETRADGDHKKRDNDSRLDPPFRIFLGIDIEQPKTHKVIGEVKNGHVENGKTPPMIEEQAS